MPPPPPDRKTMETNDSINKQSSLVKSSDKRRTTRPQTATTESEVVSSEPISSDAIEETELETTSSLTRPVSTRSPNTSANRSTRSNDKRRVVPWVEESPCTPPEYEETQSGPEAEEAEVREATQPPEHAVGAHKVRGRNYVSISSTEEHHSIRDVSRASSANDIVIPNAHVVEEDDAITAYVVEPSSIFMETQATSHLWTRKLHAALVSVHVCRVRCRTLNRGKGVQFCFGLLAH